MRSAKNATRSMISIVTPSYNQAEFIEDTIQSVYRQEYPHVEHWVIDGGSDDGTIETLESWQNETNDEDGYELKWLSEPDRGQSHAINKGFDRAKGEIVGWLNSDDMYYDVHALQAVDIAFQRTGARIVYGDDLLVGPENMILRVDHKYEYSRPRILRSCYICQPALFFHRSVLEEHRLDESLEYVMDYEFWLRLSESYEFFHLNRVVAMDRNHPNRKMLVNREALIPERESVQKAHGQTFGVAYWMGRLSDKVYSAWNRLRGVSTLYKTLNHENLTVNLNMDSWWSLLRRQLFANNEDLV